MKYTGENLKEIIFPLGGIGTGSIGIAGNGVLRDWEISNRPNKGSLNNHSHFAIKLTDKNGKELYGFVQSCGRRRDDRFYGRHLRLQQRI